MLARSSSPSSFGPAVALVAALCAAFVGVPAGAQVGGDTSVPREMRNATIVERLNERLPLDTEFIDDGGETIRLGDLFTGDRPILLQMGYFKCPMLCGLVLNATMDAMLELDWTAGTEYDLVSISVNPNETHQLADVKKQGYLLQYERPGASRGFHFLVGDADASKAVADAVGFHYEMQPDGEYAHAAGIFVITPDGRVARYLYGVEFEPRTLRFALLEASEGRIGSTVDRFILWCHQYNPDEGSYTLFARRVMSIAAVATVLAIGGGVGFMFLRDRLRGGALPPGASA